MNNSGATWGSTLAEYPDSAFTKLLTLNVQRVFTLTQKLVPLLEKGSKRDGVGRIINVCRVDDLWTLANSTCTQIGSINGEGVPNLETYAYSASKAALHQ